MGTYKSQRINNPPLAGEREGLSVTVEGSGLREPYPSVVQVQVLRELFQCERNSDLGPLYLFSFRLRSPVGLFFCSTEIINELTSVSSMIERSPLSETL